MYGEGRGGGFRPRGGSGGGGMAPVNVGEELDVKIEAVGEKGDGIARKRGFVLFVPNTREGDEVRIRVTKVLRKVGFADVIGQAQGTPEGAAAPPKREAPAPMPEPEAPPEDSEDFGEESESSEDFGDESSEEGDEPADEEMEPPELPDEPDEEEEKKEE